MPDSSSSIFSGPSRSNSLASTVSSSGASLTRRSRTVTRKRTRTIIGPRRDEEKAEDADQVLDISAANSEEPFSSPVASPSEIPDDPVATSPGAGSDAHSHSDIHGNGDADRSSATFGTFGPLIKDEHEATPGVHEPVLSPSSQPGIAPPPEPIASTPAVSLPYRHRKYDISLNATVQGKRTKPASSDGTSVVFQTCSRS
jgi:hypothetical protein